MIEISISRELADAHPGFIADCAQRGHAIGVFDHAPVLAGPRQTPSETMAPGSQDPDANSTRMGSVSVDRGQ